MRNKILAAAVAGGIVVGAALVSAAISGPGVAAAQEDSNSNQGDDSDRPDHWHGAILEEVLDDLVAAGTIDQEQADAITEALVAKAEEKRSELGELGDRPHLRRDWFRRGARLGALLDDGGIDQAEYDALGEDHPLKQLDVSQYLDDGVITIAELREIRKSQSKSGDSA